MSSPSHGVERRHNVVRHHAGSEKNERDLTNTSECTTHPNGSRRRFELWSILIGLGRYVPSLSLSLFPASVGTSFASRVLGLLLTCFTCSKHERPAHADKSSPSPIATAFSERKIQQEHDSTQLPHETVSTQASHRERLLRVDKKVEEHGGRAQVARQCNV